VGVEAGIAVVLQVPGGASGLVGRAPGQRGQQQGDWDRDEQISSDCASRRDLELARLVVVVRGGERVGLDSRPGLLSSPGRY